MACSLMPSTSERKCSSLLRRCSWSRSASALLASARRLAVRRASVSKQTSVPSTKNTRSGIAPRAERVLRTEEQVVGGQAGQDHRQQARTQAPVPRAHHHGPEEQQERNVLRDHGVQEKLDPHRHPGDQDGNAVSQERRGAFHRVHLGPVPVERAGASPTCGRAALPSMASACNHSTILRPCEVSSIPHLRYFRRFIVLFVQNGPDRHPDRHCGNGI